MFTSFACKRELDGVAPGPAETVNYDVAGAPFGDVFGDLFRCDGVPTF